MRRVAFTLVLVLTLLTPTILCAVPSASMNAAEHECCKHMKERCGDPSMSACCTIVPNTAVGTATAEKSKPSLSSDIQHAVITYPDFAPPSNALLRVVRQYAEASSPPDLPALGSTQILRI